MNQDSRLRFAAVLICSLIPSAGLIIWAFASESYFRFWATLMGGLIFLVLLPLCDLWFGPGLWKARLRRFGIAAVAIVCLGVLFKVLFRYEGSTSGSSLPKFAFRWSPKPIDEAPNLSELPAEGSAIDPESPEGVVDSLEFYGPSRDAMWSEDELVASFDWKENPPEELWRIPIGIGWSGFSVSGGRAVTQEQRGEEELVTCYELLTGKLLWAHRDSTGFYLQAAAEKNDMKEMAGDGPRSVPTIHGDRVYSYGATGFLNCLDLKTGEKIWSRPVLTESKNNLPQWGKSTSPLVIDDLGLVVVSAVENSPPTLIAYNLEDGELIWTYQGIGASYSSPRLIELHGVRQIVSVNGHDVTGNDPETGKELWNFPWPGHFPKVGQPIELPDNRLLVTASYGAGSYLLQVYRDKASWSVDPVWRSIRLKTKFSSAVVRDGYAYAMDEGRLACVDLKDASRVWKEAGYGFGQQLLVGDKLLIQAESGFVAVVKASPDGCEELARVDALSSMTWNPPTLAGRYLLVRNDKEAVCYRLSAK